MFKSLKVVPEFLNLLGWRQHFDITDFAIGTPLTVTESGEYYQQKHAALDLENIRITIPRNRGLDEYLETTVKDSINEVLNDVLQYRQLNQYGKTLIGQSTLLNRYGWKNDLITNLNRFVGMQIKVKSLDGLMAVINEIGLQFAATQTLKMYLYHSSKSEPLTDFDVVINDAGGWTWEKIDLELSAFNAQEYHGGVFILGYYQDDLTTNAINYTNFNWDIGECGTCSNTNIQAWKNIKSLYHIYPVYVPAGGFVKGEMFDMNKLMYSKNESWGLNFKLSARCDLTDFFIQNKLVFKNLLALKVVHKVLEMMKYSQQINAIEENIKHMIIRDLEGDIDTKSTNIPTKYQKELKAVNFNFEGINKVCLGCESDSYEPTYSNM